MDIERRLRTAIWQQTDLLAWLNALSDEAKQKQEWRYWMAKIAAQASDKDAKQRLEALSRERGFYPMLAAVKLGHSYKLEMHLTRRVNLFVAK